MVLPSPDRGAAMAIPAAIPEPQLGSIQLKIGR